MERALASLAVSLLLLTNLAANRISDRFDSIKHIIQNGQHCTVFAVRVNQWLGAAHCGEITPEGYRELKIDSKVDLRLLEGPTAPVLPVALKEPEIGDATTNYGWTDTLGEITGFSLTTKPLVFFGHVQAVGVPTKLAEEASTVLKNYFDEGGGPGMSGGPILNAAGEVVGVNEALAINPSLTVISPTVKQIRQFLGLK